MRAFDRLLEQFRLADALDIAVVTILLYGLVVWLRNRASRSLVMLIVGLAMLYMLARWQDLYLTALAFHYGLVGILLAMVVVYQQDVRNGLERLASRRWFKSTTTDNPSQKLIDLVVEAVGDMAANQVGALIVFPGRQPLDRHIRGGVEVDAKISFPLLLSIFHPKSPGHDGAVIVESQRLSKLGVHLPLTAQVEKVQDSGTRHAAALGLAECCDAMVVAVSEERGTITVAMDGDLSVVDPTELATRLRSYLEPDTAAANSTISETIYSGASKLAALVVAVALWFSFAYHTDVVQRTYVVPIEYRNLPDGLEIEEPKPTHAEATLSGPEQRFTLVDTAKMTISFEIGDSIGGRLLRGTTADKLTNVPADMVVEKVVPDEVVLSLRQRSQAPSPKTPHCP